MQDFEQYINTNRRAFGEDVFGLFNDSLMCCKCNIDRPAYLLAYQGMMRHLCNTILQGCKPEPYEQGKWDAMRRDLAKEERWDAGTFDAVVQQATYNDDKSVKRTSVLHMPDSVRNQFEYWRTLRNVCAHYKSSSLIKAHVISLYVFIRDYLLSMTVEGGMMTMVDEFAEYFNPAHTAPEAPIQPLLEKVPHFVRTEEYPSFIQETLNKALEYDHKYGRSPVKDFLFSILDGDNIQLKDAMCDFLNQDEETDYRNAIIDHNPSYVHQLIKGEANIRKFWMRTLFHLNRPLPVLAQLLITGKIPERERREFFSRLLTSIYNLNTSRCYDVANEEFSILQSFGYIDVFLEEYMNSSYTSHNYEKINSKYRFYEAHLFPMMTNNIARCICEVFSYEYYPYALFESVRYKFKKDSAYYEAFKESCIKQELEIPSRLTVEDDKDS